MLVGATAFTTSFLISPFIISHVGVPAITSIDDSKSNNTLISTLNYTFLPKAFSF